MPLTVKFGTMEISLNSRTKKILELLQESLKNNKIDENIFKKISETERKGLWGVLLYITEQATGELKDYTLWTFPPQNIDLDASAFVLFNAYQYYLNMVIEKMSISAKQAQNVEINNSIVLLRGLLLRMAAIALKVKIDDIEHGEKVIECLNEFVGSINKNEILINKGFFSDKLTYFGVQLATNHDDWIAVFRNMTKIIKAIHLPITTISEMIGFLLASKNAIARHIIVRSKYSVKNAELSDDWIMNTFINFEKKYSKTSMQINSNDENMFGASVWNTTEFTEIHTEILYLLKDDKSIPHQRIKELFEFFNKTNLLFQIAVQVENLIQIGGWIPIINGLIKIDSLQTLFSKYIKEYEKTIKISAQELIDNSKDITYHELIKYKNPNIVLHGFSIVNHIDLLKSPFIRQQISTVIGRSISQLSNVNAEIESLISIEELKNMANSEDTMEVAANTVSTLENNFQEISLDTFNILLAWYKKDKNFLSKPSKNTNKLFEDVKNAKNDKERAKIISDYRKDNTNKGGKFYSILDGVAHNGSLFKKLKSSMKIEKKLSLSKEFTAYPVRERIFFEAYEVSADGNCGYTAFGIERKDAYRLLKDNINQVRDLLIPVVKEELVKEKFINYLIESNFAGEGLLILFTKRSTQQQAGLNIDNIDEQIFAYANNLNVITDYLDYDVKDKKIDAGWSHPCVLQALAHIRKIRLYIWVKEENQLVPHKQYPQYIPQGATENKHLLFVNSNHFELLLENFSQENEKPLEPEHSYQYDYKKAPTTKRLATNKRTISRLLTTPDEELLVVEVENTIGNLLISKIYLTLWDMKKSQNDSYQELLISSGIACRIDGIAATDDNNCIFINVLSTQSFYLIKRQLFCWNRLTKEVKPIENIYTDRALAIFPDNTVLLRENSLVTLWNLSFNNSLNTFDNSEKVNKLEILTNENFAGNSSNDILIWNKTHTQPIKTLTGHMKEVTILKKLSNELLASGSNDQTIRIWNISTGTCEKVLTGHASAITSLACLSNQYLASGDKRGIICIWDYQSFECVQKIFQHTGGSVNDLTFLSDGRLTSAGDDNCVFIHTFSPISNTLTGSPATATTSMTTTTNTATVTTPNRVIPSVFHANTTNTASSTISNTLTASPVTAITAMATTTSTTTVTIPTPTPS